MYVLYIQISVFSEVQNFKSSDMEDVEPQDAVFASNWFLIFTINFKMPKVSNGSNSSILLFSFTYVKDFHNYYVQ